MTTFTKEELELLKRIYVRADDHADKIVNEYANSGVDYCTRKILSFERSLLSCRWSQEIEQEKAQLILWEKALEIAKENAKPSFLKDLRNEIETWCQGCVTNYATHLQKN